MKSRTCMWIAVVCLIAIFAVPLWMMAQEIAGAAQSVVPRVVRFSGVLRDVSGSPLAGPVSVTFTLHREREGGSPLWAETHDVVPDARGSYSVLLGSSRPEGLPVELFASGEARWVGVRVAGQTEGGRTLLLSVPYALKARDAETIGGLPASAFVLAAPVGDGADAVSASQQVVRGSASAVTGGGTANFVPVWTSAAALGNSPLFASNGMVGIGNTAPGATLDVVGAGVGSAFGPAPLAFRAMGGKGGRFGDGGAVQLAAGTGGPFAPFSNVGGSGGSIYLGGGSAGTCAVPKKPCPSFLGANGGSIRLMPGAPGSVGRIRRPGNVLVAPLGGLVGIGTETPTSTLTIGVGLTTLADHWTTRSSRRLKTNIEPLVGALQKVEQLQGVSYRMKGGGTREIGVVAEDVARVVPEVVSLNAETREVEGLDYSRLTALLIEAVKAQQVEIEQLKGEVLELKAKQVLK